MCAHAEFIAFGRQLGRHWVSAHAEFIAFGRTGGIGCVPMQNLLLLAQLKALGQCPCKFLLLLCPAKFIAFGTEGIGCVPMQNLLLLAQLKALGVCPCKIYCFWQNFWQNWRHWVCAHAEFIAFGTTEGIGCVPMQNLLLLAQLKALGVCPCRSYLAGPKALAVCPCQIYYFWHN